MSERRTSDHGIPTTDAPPEVGHYRNPSLLAALTVLMALLSLMALSGTTLWFVPWLTVLLGIVTLRSLAIHPEKMGRRPVLAALALAIFLGTFGPARYYSRRVWLESKAKDYASQWLELVRKNQLDEAYQLHILRKNRIEKNLSFDEYYKETPGIKVDFNEFFDGDALRTLVMHRKTAKIRYDGVYDFFPKLDFDLVALRYVVDYEQDGETRHLPLYVEIVRDGVAFQGAHDWFVGRVEVPLEKSI